jgi:Domain of Unknown Function with PDB structure (DUF3865)
MDKFQHLAQSLTDSMRHDYAAVNQRRNPVAGIMARATFDQLAYILQQYSIFPKAIVLWMEIAQQKVLEAKWMDLAHALAENVADEMGKYTDGISHYTILAEGLEMGLGMPIQSATPSAATANLLTSMDAIFARQPACVLGAIYAIEATSIPELTLVMQVLELAIEGALPEKLHYFFDMHLNQWEPKHEAELKVNIAKYITSNDFDAFESGFRAVMMAMDNWWSDLVSEAIFFRSLSGSSVKQHSYPTVFISNC